MPGWFRGAKSEPVPDWAQPLTAEQYRQFADTIRRVLDSQQVAGDREPSPLGTLNVTNRHGEPVQIGLQNLAQSAAGEPQTEWVRMATEYLGSLVEPDEHPTDRASALAQLRVRFWPPDYLQQTKDAVYREVAHGIVIVLVVDLHKSIAGVQGANLVRWGISEAEAWSAAERNTANEPFEVLENPGPAGTMLTFLVGDNLYVSSHALWLDRHLKIDPDRGALVGIPTRHLVAAYAIDDLKILQVVPAMLGSNRRIFNDGPGSISPELYWWHRGAFVHIPTGEKDGRPTVTPPDEFVQLLNSLAAAK